MIPNYSGSLRYFGRIKNGTTPASGEAEYWDGDVRWATPEDLGKLVGDRIALTKRQVTEKAVIENNLNILPVGSVLISTRAPIGHMAITAEPMTFNQGCRGIIPNERVDGAFLYYLLKSRVPELNAVANGTTFVELSRDELAAIQVSFPPLETQRRIAQFLDEKTARIDGLIEKKSALLERLAEKRQALITRAVTKGLNPDAPMKPSGIDWLGDIPAHWEVKRFRFTAKLISGSTPTTTVSEYWDGDVPWISPKDVKADELFTSIDHVTEYAVSDYGLKLHEEDNAVIVIRGMILARKVPVSVARGRYTINQDMKVIRSKGEVLPEYFQMYLTSIESFLFTLIEEAGHGTKALRTDVLSDVPVLIPPLQEQNELVKALVQNREETDSAINRIQASIERLVEYRAALITAAVTGQLEVT